MSGYLPPTDMSRPFVAAVLLESRNYFSNRIREETLLDILEDVSRLRTGAGVVLFPGGFFDAGRASAHSRRSRIENSVRNKLDDLQRDWVVCLGVDGRGYRDQLAMAIGKEGILAVARKFHAAPNEQINLAKAPLVAESYFPRIFSFNRIRYFLAVCYDSFGIRHRRLPNPEVDVVLNLVHQFNPSSERMSNERNFARHGFAGASRQWNCLVFGSAVFFHRRVSESWPTGVYWDQGDRSTMEWKYNDNAIRVMESIRKNIPEGEALIRFYDIRDCRAKVNKHE